MVIFRWLFLVASTEATLTDEQQLFPDGTIRSWPLNRRNHTPRTWLGIALSRKGVYLLALTSTMLLHMAFVAIMMLHRDTKVKVRSPDGDTDYFDIVAGVLQEGRLAPYRFIIRLDYVLRTSK